MSPVSPVYHTVESVRLPFLSAFLWNCFLCWDRWNGDVTPTLDAALLCSSRAGSDIYLFHFSPLQDIYLSYKVI